jgi:hypothetical protein
MKFYQDCCFLGCDNHVVWYKVNILEESVVCVFVVGEDGGSLLFQNVVNLVTDYMFRIPEDSALYFQ